MLLSKGKITEDLVNMLLSWRHSGFNVFLWSKNQARRGRGHGKRCIGIYSCKRLFPGVWCYIALTMAYQIQISFQNSKYQRVTDILNPLGLGVKISFESVEKPLPENWISG
jgi:hypothetical protein